MVLGVFIMINGVDVVKVLPQVALPPSHLKVMDAAPDVVKFTLPMNLVIGELKMVTGVDYQVIVKDYRSLLIEDNK